MFTKCIKFIKEHGVNLLIAGLFLVVTYYGYNCYQELTTQKLQFKNEFAKLFFTPFSLAALKALALLMFFIFVSMLIPSAFKSLKKFKFFQFEVELEAKEKAIYDKAKDAVDSVFFLSEVLNEDVKNEVLTSISKDDGYEKVLEMLFEELHIYLKEHTKLNIPIQILKGDEVVGLEEGPLKDMAETSLETGKASIENAGIVFKPNYMVYSLEFEGEVYAVVMKSRNRKFSAYEGNMVKGITEAGKTYFEMNRLCILVNELS
ncbi:hypothetical protein [Bacillus sp. Brlt_9]|uniref:hypothetical protein n=1 Tax=Bacillus sp. Brlt_9 TaxID=3110916 RepID=UPI003F7B49AE